MNAEGRRRGLYHGVLAIAIATTALGLFMPRRALGQESEAASLFRAGTAAYERGDFGAAAVAFEDAHLRAPRAATMYNVGLAWQAAGQPARAADAFEACVAFGGLEAQSLEDARSRLRDLEPHVGIVRITGPDGYVASFAHLENATLPRRVRLKPGNYEVRAHGADGDVVTRSIAVRAGTSLEVVLASPPVGAAPQRKIGWVTLGAGAATGLVTTGLGVSALAARGRFARSGYTDADARSSADTLRTWTNVAIVATAAFGVTGVVLLLTAPKAGSAPVHAVVVGPASLGWTYAF